MIILRIGESHSLLSHIVGRLPFGTLQKAFYKCSCIYVQYTKILQMLTFSYLSLETVVKYVLWFLRFAMSSWSHEFDI